jgi:MSHA biogenesis protein MshK
MAAYLSAGLAVIALLAAAPLQAQGMSDPMRPPREILGGAEHVETPPSTSPAQVVIISPDRRQATINGRTVSVGGRYGDATLTKISDEELVLQKPDSTEVIRLYSSVNRRMRSPAEQGTTNTAEKREE